MAFIAALVLLGAFVLNVAVGAFSDGPIVGIVGSVTEMLVLLSASVCFVVGILQCERAEKKS